jgi:hypothetical protein
MTCRLPQTPRTPTAAAAHYFDDVLSTGPRPKKPSQLRRSSTTRSIGFRSDYGGDDDDEDGPNSPVRRKNSVGYLDEDAIKAKQEIQDRFNHYVSGQLERVKTGMQDYEPDELAASVDGADERPRGRHGSKTKSNGHKERAEYFEQDEYFSR